jgi:parallel beta-helix repeat protein
MNRVVLIKRALLVIVSISMIASIFASSGAMAAQSGEGPLSALTFVSSPTIHIDSDSQLASLISSNLWAGTGTLSDPYIIENLQISAVGTGNAIFIGNTTAHLIIRDCSLAGAILRSSPYQAGNGITLYNVRDVMVENTDCHGSVNGMFVESSNNCTLSRNNCTGNSNDGIYLDKSKDTTISNNTCTDTIHGIYVASSNNNIILNDTCKGDRFCGIMLFASSFNLLSEINSSYSGNNGLHLAAGSNFNSVLNCTFNGNYNDGISVEDSNNNTLYNNTCNVNNYLGINFYHSNHNNVVSNYCSGNFRYGLNLYSSNNNRFYGNALIDNNGASFVHAASHIQAYDDASNYWNSTTYGNYWSDWSSPDINADGIVDSAYSIDGGSGSDALPTTLTLNISSPSAITYTNATTATIAGNAIAHYGISNIVWRDQASGTSGSCSGTSQWTASVPMVLGNNNIIVTVTDGKGIRSQDNVTFIYDTNGPTVITSPNGTGIDIDAKIVVHFSEPMNLSSVLIIVSGSVEGNVTFEGNNATYVPDALHYDKDYTVTVTGKDLAGNSVQKTWTFSTIRTLGGIAGTVRNLDGIPIASATITLNNGAATSTGTDGNFSFDGVTPGPYTLTVSKAGYDNLTVNLTVTAGSIYPLGTRTITATVSSGSDMTWLLLGIIVVVAVAAVGLIYIMRRPKAP